MFKRLFMFLVLAFVIFGLVYVASASTRDVVQPKVKETKVVVKKLPIKRTEITKLESDIASLKDKIAKL